MQSPSINGLVDVVDRDDRRDSSEERCCRSSLPSGGLPRRFPVAINQQPYSTNGIAQGRRDLTLTQERVTRMLKRAAQSVVHWRGSDILRLAAISAYRIDSRSGFAIGGDQDASTALSTFRTDSTLNCLTDRHTSRAVHATP